MKKYFRFEESVEAPHKFIILPNHENIEKFFKPPITGSYGLLPARLLNLSPAQYCRFCRDVLGAELVGKNCKYIAIYFKKTEEAQMLLRLLNKRMEFLDREFDKTAADEVPWKI